MGADLWEIKSPVRFQRTRLSLVDYRMELSNLYLWKDLAEVCDFLNDSSS